ncbi:MAG: rod shape-determining protein MreD [Spirochaetes bacterium]|jgi:rod shape-determining protein MreD|nr:rod shape-determining protein MreD [Spirochaetota bacterium]
MMITAYIFTAAIIVISLIIQGHSSFDALSIAGVKPDLTFIAVIYFAYSFGSFYGEITGFISGILHDAISNSPLGLLAFPKMALGYFAGMFGRSILKQNMITVFLMLFAASILKGAVTLFLSYIFHEASISAILNIILPESFYNALVAPPLFFIFDKIFEDVHPLEG